MTLGKRALSGSGSRGGAPAISPSYCLLAWLGWLQPKPWPETSTTRPALGSRAVGVMGIPLLIPSQAKQSEAKQARRQATPRAPARRSAPRGWWPVGVAANRHRQVQTRRSARSSDRYCRIQRSRSIIASNTEYPVHTAVRVQLLAVKASPRLLKSCATLVIQHFLLFSFL